MPLYGKEWAQERLLEFVERYPRGWSDLAYLCRSSRQSLFTRGITALRSNQVQWEAIKRLVRSLDRDPTPFTNLRLRDRQTYLRHLWYVAIGEALDTLHSEDEDQQILGLDTPLDIRSN